TKATTPAANTQPSRLNRTLFRRFLFRFGVAGGGRIGARIRPSSFQDRSRFLTQPSGNKTASEQNGVPGPKSARARSQRLEHASANKDEARETRELPA